MKKQKGLGRGLEALLGPKVVETHPAHRLGLPALADGAAHDPSTADGVRMLDVDLLEAGKYQPRSHMDEGALYELAQSIKSQGVMQPLLVRGIGAGRFEVIAGERRLRASRLAGLKEVPVLIKAVDDRTAAAMALIENMQREDLNPLEQAQGLQRLIKEFGLTHEEVAQAVGSSRSAVSNVLRLLNLAQPVQTMLMAGDLDMGHARALLSLDRASQITAAQTVVSKKLSVRQAESMVKKISAAFSLKAVSAKPVLEPPRDIQRVEDELSDHLGAQVHIRIKRRVRQHGRIEQQGEVLIQFGSIDVLHGILERIKKA